MPHIFNALIGLCVAAASMGALSQNVDEHKDHHTKGTTSPAAATKKSTAKSVNADKLASMDKQMKDMRAMHEKMASAKTPEERQTLMAEHMKMMQEGMGMMKQMGGMSGMGDIQGGKGMSGNMADRQQMMESLMQMMIDCTPSTPTK